MDLPVFYYANGTAFGSNIFGNEMFMPFSGTGGDLQVKGVNGEYYAWNSYIPDDPFPRLLSTSLWQYVRVPYPASALAMLVSIKNGVDWVVNQVLTTTTPGTAFAVGGYSQGACVAAGVVRETLGSGRLAFRASDLRACVTFGNPVREVNHTWPGSSGYSGAGDIFGSTRGGHGIFPANLRMQNTPSYVWDFTMPNEVVTGIGDSPGGILTQLFAGGAISNIVTGIAGMIGFAAFLQSLLGIAVAPASVPRNGANLAQTVITNPLTGGTSFLDGGGHVLYPFFPPPDANGIIPSTGDTCYQIAARYLNTVGQTIFDEKNPTVPAPTTPATYQWFTSLANG